MFDHDAWMKRGAERQELSRKLQSIVEKKEIDCPMLDYELSAIIFQYLAEASNLETTAFAEPGTAVRTMAEDLFEKEILPAIQKFTNAKEEQFMILIKLREWVDGLLTGQFVCAFNLWESTTFNKQ